MRKVVKDFNTRPISLISTRRFYISALAGVQASGGWTEQASKIYSSDSIKRELEVIYKKKCAFCEILPLGSPAQVEHFRPKNGVNGIIHTGYYWLAYEWSNLLLSCGNCNTHKNNNFPINVAAARVTAPTLLEGIIDEYSNSILNNPLRLEGALILNPEIDEPNRHIGYDLHGKIIQKSIRGKTTIELCNLNRDELYVNGRMKIINDIFEKLFKRLERYNSEERSAKIVIEDIEDVINDMIIGPIVKEESFTNFYKILLLNFDIFFIDQFVNTKDKIILKRAYKKSIS